MLEIVFCQVQTAPVPPLGGPLDSRAASLAAMVVLGLLGLAAFGLIYYRKRRLQHTVEAQFKDFRERAVALMDELVRQSSSCRRRLDRLNQGHEQAREHLKAAREELAAIQSAISKGTGVLLPSDPHHGEIEAAEQALAEAERRIEADPIGAGEAIVRTRRDLSALSGRPDGRTGWRGESPSSYTMIDELAAAAERLRAAAARLRLTDLLGLFVRAWVAVWVIGILFGLLTTLIPLIIFVAGFLIILVGAWMFWRAVASWFWFGLRR